MTISPRPSNYVWKYSPHSEKQKDVYLYLYTKGQDLKNLIPPTMAEKLEEQSKKIKAILSTYRETKIKIEDYEFKDLLPEHVYRSYTSSHAMAQKWIFENLEKPPEYRILSMAHELAEEIAAMPLSVEGISVRYNIFGTKTGRLTTLPGSYPILTLSKEKRSEILPRNDLFVELDFNGAEIRTLLALSGLAQPEEDIHQWNMTHLPPWVTRKEAKEAFFAWLYGTKNEEHPFSSLYSKEIYRNHWNAGLLTTPFSRQIEVDERRALNYLLQSTTSDIVLENAHKVASLLQGKRSFIAFTMHDSVVVDYAAADLAALEEVVESFETTRLGRYKASVSMGKDFCNMRAVTNA